MHIKLIKKKAKKRIRALFIFLLNRYSNYKR